MRKQHSYEDRLKYMKMLEEGYGKYYVHRHFGVSQDLLGSLWIKYQKEGPSALKRKKRIKCDGAFREAVVRDLQENHLTLYEASVRHDVSVPQISAWLRIVREKGMASLYGQISSRRPPKDMGRPKKKKPEEMTELERLRYENERLRAENALLKKVRALVEEREAHLREIGRKPSKD